MSNKGTLPLFLSVKATNWRMNDKNSLEHDTEFQAVRKKALERDQYTCRFCGFRNMKWQEVHHFNDDHADNRLENLVTTCIFCHMCQHIGLAGHNKEAVLIYCPLLSQAQIHHIVRTALVADRNYESFKGDENQTATRKQAMKVAGEYAEIAKAVLVALRDMTEGARKHILTSDPVDLANAMLMMPDEVYAKRKDILSGIRLLPLGVRMQNGENMMLSIVETWRTGGPYTSIIPSTWKTLATQFS